MFLKPIVLPAQRRRMQLHRPSMLRREREPIAAGAVLGLALWTSSPSTPDKSWPVEQMISCGSHRNTDSYPNPAETVSQVDRRILAVTSIRRRPNGRRSGHSPPMPLAAFRCSRGRCRTGSMSDGRCLRRCCHGGLSGVQVTFDRAKFTGGAVTQRRRGVSARAVTLDVQVFRGGRRSSPTRVRPILMQESGRSLQRLGASST